MSEENGNAGKCEACGKAIRAGQPVQCWDDIGEAHSNCDEPWKIPSPVPSPDANDGGPLYINLGEPLRLYRLDSIAGSQPTISTINIYDEREAAAREALEAAAEMAISIFGDEEPEAVYRCHDIGRVTQDIRLAIRAIDPAQFRGEG